MSDEEEKNSRYIVEFIAMGKSMKVTAIDPSSLREVCIIGNSRAPRRQLSELAVRKLRYMLRKDKDA